MRGAPPETDGARRPGAAPWLQARRTEPISPTRIEAVRQRSRSRTGRGASSRSSRPRGSSGPRNPSAVERSPRGLLDEPLQRLRGQGPGPRLRRPSSGTSSAPGSGAGSRTCCSRPRSLRRCSSTWTTRSRPRTRPTARPADSIGSGALRPRALRDGKRRRASRRRARRAV